MELPATKEVMAEWRNCFRNYSKIIKAQAQQRIDTMLQISNHRPNGADVMEFAHTLNDAELARVVRAWCRREFSLVFRAVSGLESGHEESA